MDITGIGAAANLINTIVNRVCPDKSQQEKDLMAQQLVLLQGELENQKAQIENNTEEAKNPSIFVSGWRPFCGWMCVCACGWNWLGLPIATCIAAVFHYKLDVSPANLTEMLPILMGMLGLGTLRTFEKFNGVDRK